jgi:HWE histidine kinase
VSIFGGVNASITYETVRRRKDGSLIDVSLTVSPVKDGAGKVAGATKIVRDITERKADRARQDMLTGEIQHRTKNLFAVVQSVVTRSFAGKKTVDEAQAAVLSWLHSLPQRISGVIPRKTPFGQSLQTTRLEERASRTRNSACAGGLKVQVRRETPSCR